MDILIPVETASRELPYKILIAIKLTEKGYKCYLGNKSSINLLVNHFKKYIFLDKGYHESVSENLYASIKKNYGIIISLDEEGAVDFKNNNTLANRYSNFLFKNASKIFLWGNAQLEILKGLQRDISNVTVSGHPRFELLKKNYHFIYEEKTNYLKNKYGDFILINTNMGFGNNIKGDQFVEDNYGSRFKNILAIINFDKEKFSCFINLIKAMASFSNKKIIIRPHPEENKERYEIELNHLPNVHVIYEDSVIPWLIAADITIHPDCTTAIESLMLGKKTISFLPKDYDSNLVTSLPLLSSRCTTEVHEVLEILRHPELLKEQINFDDYPFLENNFNFSKTSFEIVINEISALHSLQTKTKNKIDIGTRLKLNFISYKNIFNINSSLYLNRNKLKGFNKKNVQALHRAIAEKLNIHSKLIPICPNLYLFKNDY